MKDYVVCYQVKSGFNNVSDEITLIKPSTDNYEILHVTLPQGYEYFDYLGVTEILNPNGVICSLARTGRFNKNGNVIAFTNWPHEITMDVLPFTD